MIEVKRRFGEAIRNQRIRLHLSQEELADRAGLHRTYVSDVERGSRNISLDTIERLAGALRISVSTLFKRAGNGGAHDPFIDILMVEDNPRDVALTMRAFQKARIANILHVARDGVEALDFLFATGIHERRRDQPLPGLILLDLNLPKMDGLEVLRRIKADKRTRQIPVIVLTVSDLDRDMAACRQLGVQSYIVKPVGFLNFSEVTQQMRMEWGLKKASRVRATAA
jgi:CheY-like chemotaxis protein/DNA-binding Xre family transcriptional regulator